MLLALAAIVVACGGDSEPTEDAASTTPSVIALTPADIGEARLDTIAGGVLLSGALEPARRVELKAQIDGTVGSLLVDRGSTVRKGQLLLTINAEGIRDQAASSASAIAAAKAGVAVAEQRRDGSRALFAKGAISELDLRAAEAQYEAAVADLVAVQAGATSAQESASRTRITSPIDGAVSDRQVQVGEPVSNGGPLLTIVDVRTLELAGQVGVDIASQLKTGMSVEFTVESRPDQSYRGRVARIDPEADPGTRQVGVYVQLPNANRELTAGQYATGRVLLGTPSALVVVPNAAVRMRDGKSMVAVVADGQIRLQEVSIVTRDEARGLVGLSGGLEAGARILVMPGSGLDHGTQVRVVNTSTPNDSGRPPVAPVGEKN
jgi:RND family efflux transporter MFP subunit